MRLPSEIIADEPLPIPGPPKPPHISDEHRYESTHILGPSGAGKTTLIQELLLSDLSRADCPALIVIDPKGFMVERIARLRNIPRDRLVIIDPEQKPPLNLFRPSGNDKLLNQSIASFDYIFSQSGAALSPLMRPAFRFCARLMFTVPGADILQMMDFLESKPGDHRFQTYTDRLTDPGAKRFFERDFHTERYRQTREQIKARFHDILSMPQVMAMFSSKSPSLDMMECLEKRKVVLVNTALHLGTETSTLLGRYMISLTLSAAFARGRGGPPAFLFIDEFQDYVDEEATPRQLRLAREYNLGLVLAHQQIYALEFTDALRSSISSTTVKYCSKLYGKDKRYMLDDLGCGEAMLEAQVPDKEKKLVKFVCVVKGHRPVPIAIAYPNITPPMQMSEAEYRVLLEDNRRALHPQTHKAPEAETAPLPSVAVQTDQLSIPAVQLTDAASEW